MTPQEKIDEIHSILVKWESRRKWKNIFSWAYRLVIIGFLILVIFFPNILFGFFVKIFTPIIENTVNQAIETQKQNISSVSDNLTEKAKNLYNDFSSRNN